MRRPPDDDAGRLAIADALDERGDLRGSFIRLQCELARLDVTDRARPALEVALARVSIDAARTADIEAAGLVMPKLRPSEPWHFSPTWTFWRGFVEHLFAKASPLASHGEALSDTHPIQSLAIDALKVSDAAKLASRAWLKNVSALSTTGPRRALLGLLRSQHLSVRHLRLSVEAAALAEILALQTRSRSCALVTPREARAAARRPVGRGCGRQPFHARAAEPARGEAKDKQGTLELSVTDEEVHPLVDSSLPMR